MFDSITIQEFLQLFLTIRKAYPVFGKQVDIDGYIEMLAYCEGEYPSPWMYERLLWVMTRFAQFLYRFPVQYEMDKLGRGFQPNPNADC